MFVASTAGLPTSRQFSVEERKLIALHPVMADVICEPASNGGGASWEWFNWDIVELETNILQYSVVDSARVPTSHPKPFTGIDQDWNTWWRDFTLDMRQICGMSEWCSISYCPYCIEGQGRTVWTCGSGGD